MNPAFSSTRQAVAFLLLIVLLLGGPVLAGKRFLPPREQIYSSTSWHWGSYPYLDQQIFKEKGDIDIAFVGASRGWYDIDTPYLQKALSRQMGRETTVLNLCWFWSGFDATYFITKDLLEHRKVKMLVFTDEQSDAVQSGKTDFHRSQCMSYRWFRYGDGAGELAGLSLQNQASLYSGAILGLPRNLLCLVRANLPRNTNSSHLTFMTTEYHAPDPFGRLGSLSCPMSYDYGPDFVPFQPPVHNPPPAPVIYSAATRANFRFTGPHTQSMELNFFKKFIALTEEHGVKLVMIHYPLPGEPSDQKEIDERECWPELMDTNLTLIGMSPAQLFAGLSEEEKMQLFCNMYHLNQNGQEYFTPLITPTLVNIYEMEANH